MVLAHEERTAMAKTVAKLDATAEELGLADMLWFAVRPPEYDSEGSTPPLYVRMAKALVRDEASVGTVLRAIWSRQS